MSLENQTELLSRIAEGDEKAFRRLFDHYWDRVYLVAFTLTKSAELSKEMAQDIFLKIWQKREQLPGVLQFESWLFITARNHILNQLRKKSHDKEFTDHLEAHFSGSSVTPEQELLLKETQQLVAMAIRQMPQRQREVYTLSRKEGLDTAAIGRRLGISRLTVKSHLTKALQHIREYILPSPDKFFLFLLILPPYFMCL
ncbi:MAG: RNA polymerase sigma-70 factor [Bacteroidetes bacterium]|nr:RNA polymerase sigma-70 factor [Bacteroidota bacterium]